MKRVLFLSLIVVFLVACVSTPQVTVRPATANETLPIATSDATPPSFPSNETDPPPVATKIPTQPPPPTFNPRPQGVASIDLAPPLPTAVLSQAAIQPENAQTLNQVKVLNNRGGQGIRFTQDGSKLLVLQDVLRVWEMSNQIVVAELPIRMASYSPFSVSPDGQILVIGNYETQGDLQFWSLATKQMVREYKGGEQVRYLSFNILGNLLAVGRVDGSFNVLDMGSGETVASRGGHVSNCEGITFNPITGQLTVNNDASIDVWDNSLQQIQYNLKNPKGCEVSQIEYSPNGEILAASMFFEKQILLWKTGNYLTTLTHSNSGTIWKIAWSPNGRLLAAVENNTSPGQIVLWDVQSQKIAHVLEGYGSEVSFSPDGKYIVTQSEQGALVLLSLSATP